MKNVKELNWGKENEIIVNDFLNQNILNLETGLSSRVVLVVSSEDLARKLRASMPSKIHSFSDVEVFAPPENPGNLELWPDEFKDNLKFLCFSEEDQDKLAALGLDHRSVHPLTGTPAL